MADTSVATGIATVVTGRLHFNTKGDADMVNLTADVRQFVKDTGLSDGAVTVFVPGATGAVTTLEFEPGVVQDFATSSTGSSRPTSTTSTTSPTPTSTATPTCAPVCWDPRWSSRSRRVSCAWASGRRSASSASTTAPGNAPS